MSNINKNIAGSFGKKEIPFSYNSVDNCQEVVIFFHGLASSSFDKEPTNAQLLALDLQQQKRSSTCLYESSRNFRKLDNPEVKFEIFLKESFKGKRLEDELEDGDRVVKEVKRIWKEKADVIPILHFVGFSLGGIIALLLTERHEVKSLTTFGTALQFTSDGERPIIGKKFDNQVIHKIQKAAKNFHGDVTIVRGTADTTSLEEETQQLVASFKKSSSIRYQRLTGVEHRFKKRNEKEDNTIIQEMLKLIMSNF